MYIHIDIHAGGSGGIDMSFIGLFCKRDMRIESICTSVYIYIYVHPLLSATMSPYICIEPYNDMCVCECVFVCVLISNASMEYVYTPFE